MEQRVYRPSLPCLGTDTGFHSERRPAEQISLSSQDQAPMLRGLILPSTDGDDCTCRPTSPFANECCCTSNFTRLPKWQHKTHGRCGNEGILIFLMVAWAIVSMASQVWRRVYPRHLSFRAQMHWASSVQDESAECTQDALSLGNYKKVSTQGPWTQITRGQKQTRLRNLKCFLCGVTAQAAKP